MPYNNLISRADSQALVTEVVSQEMLQRLADQSAAMSLFRRIPMGTNQTRFPVLSALPTAYFVTGGDTGVKQTTETNWANKYMTVEEIAAIVPIPENVLSDVSFSIEGEVRPLVEEAIGRALDAAIFFGTNIPASWTTAIGAAGIVAAAVAAGNTYAQGTATQAQGGIAEDINQLMKLIETDGYDVNGFVTNRLFRASLRGLRDTTGQKLLDVTDNTIDGQPVRYAMRALWPATSTAQLIAGDYTTGILGIRQDMTWKILDQAVIQDATGAIIFNLAQQDMIALRLTFRAAFAVSNPINWDQPTESARWPFGVLHT